MVNDIGKGRGNDWIWSKNPVARNVLARRQKSVRPSKKHSDEDSFYIFIIGISSHNHCTTSLEFLFAWTIFFCPHLFCSFKTHDLSLTFPTQVVEPQKVRDARDALPRCQDRIDAEHKDLQLAYFQAKTGWVSSTDGDGRECRLERRPFTFSGAIRSYPPPGFQCKDFTNDYKSWFEFEDFFFWKNPQHPFVEFLLSKPGQWRKGTGDRCSWARKLTELDRIDPWTTSGGISPSRGWCWFLGFSPRYARACQKVPVPADTYLGICWFSISFFFKHESLSKRKMTDSFGESFLPIGILRHVPVWHASKTWSHKCGGSGWVAFAVWLGWRFVFGWSYWNSRSLTS